MLPFNPHAIRPATDTDTDALRRLAELESQRPLAGRVLIAERDGASGAAISIDDRRAIADPFQETAGAVAALRVRADALTAVERTPSLSERMLAAVRVRGIAPAAGRA
jgi:hypothetical protein